MLASGVGMLPMLVLASGFGMLVFASGVGMMDFASGVCLFCDLKNRTSKLEYKTNNIKNGLFPLIQKPFSCLGLRRIRP